MTRDRWYQEIRREVEGDYDVITVGGGLAAGALATRLARAGQRVLVLEGARTFRDRVRGEWLAPWGVGELRELGVYDALEAAGAHELPSLIGRGGKARRQGEAEGDTPVTFYHPRMQRSLLEAARAAGADVITGARVRSVEPGTPAQVSVEIAGVLRRVTARLIVGADGRNSLARKALGQQPIVHRCGRLLAGARVSGVRGDESEGYFIIRDDGLGLASVFPQGGGVARVYVFKDGVDGSTFTGPRGFANFIELAVESGVPREVLAEARLVGPLASFVADDSYLDSPIGEGVVLIGDAAGISDPTWGQGMALAFRDARVLAEELLDASDWRRALLRYAQRHDQHFRAIVTAENWLAEIFLVPGEEAAARRIGVMKHWAKHPEVAIDLPTHGPNFDISPGAKARVFGEALDELEPLAAPLPEPALVASA